MPSPCRARSVGPTGPCHFQTGKLAGQADGAVVARIGDTVVLATATAARKVREGTDFFPLTVDIEERMYAAGKIPGSFFRREGRATDQAILTCPPHRPAAAALVPRRLPQRGPRRRHHPRRRPGEPARRAGDQRRLGGADDLGHPLRRPDRRRPHRLHDRGRPGSRTPPTRRATTRPSSSSSPGARSPRTPTPRSPS